MTDPRDEALSPVKRALLEIRELKAQLARSNAALHEPIAIVGMALRLPGGVVEPHETLEQALVREVREGTGLLVSGEQTG